MTPATRARLQELVDDLPKVLAWRIAERITNWDRTLDADTQFVRLDDLNEALAACLAAEGDAGLATPALNGLRAAVGEYAEGERGRLIDAARNLLAAEGWDKTAFAIQVLQNFGADTECGACMEVAFTGMTQAAHTCKALAAEGGEKPPEVFIYPLDGDGWPLCHHGRRIMCAECVDEAQQASPEGEP